MATPSDVVGDVHVPEVRVEGPPTHQSSHLQWVRDYQRQAHREAVERSDVEHHARREKGLGVVLDQWTERARGHVLRERHVVRVNNDEHVLVCCYSNFQLLIHVLDNLALVGDGSRFQSCWERNVAPKDISKILRKTEDWLKRRAAKRAQARSAA